MKTDASVGTFCQGNGWRDDLKRLRLLKVGSSGDVGGQASLSLAETWRRCTCDTEP
jgi:hypothetical protein